MVIGAAICHPITAMRPTATVLASGCLRLGRLEGARDSATTWRAGTTAEAHPAGIWSSRGIHGRTPLMATPVPTMAPRVEEVMAGATTAAEAESSSTPEVEEGMIAGLKEAVHTTGTAGSIPRVMTSLSWATVGAMEAGWTGILHESVTTAGAALHTHRGTTATTDQPRMVPVTASGAGVDIVAMWHMRCRGVARHMMAEDTTLTLAKRMVIGSPLAEGIEATAERGRAGWDQDMGLRGNRMHMTTDCSEKRPESERGVRRLAARTAMAAGRRPGAHSTTSTIIRVRRPTRSTRGAISLWSIMTGRWTVGPRTMRASWMTAGRVAWRETRDPKQTTTGPGRVHTLRHAQMAIRQRIGGRAVRAAMLARRSSTTIGCWARRLLTDEAAVSVTTIPLPKAEVRLFKRSMAGLMAGVASTRCRRRTCGDRWALVVVVAAAARCLRQCLSMGPMLEGVRATRRFQMSKRRGAVNVQRGLPPHKWLRRAGATAAQGPSREMMTMMVICNFLETGVQSLCVLGCCQAR